MKNAVNRDRILLLCLNYGSTAHWWTLTAFLGFLVIYTIGRAPCRGNYPFARSLSTCEKTGTHRHTRMPLVGFELTTAVFERTKTVHALDRAVSE
jgi:hypothetical protein